MSYGQSHALSDTWSRHLKRAPGEPSPQKRFFVLTSPLIFARFGQSTVSGHAHACNLCLSPRALLHLLRAEAARLAMAFQAAFSNSTRRFLRQSFKRLRHLFLPSIVIPARHLTSPLPQ